MPNNSARQIQDSSAIHPRNTSAVFIESNIYMFESNMDVEMKSDIRKKRFNPIITSYQLMIELKRSFCPLHVFECGIVRV